MITTKVNLPSNHHQPIDPASLSLQSYGFLIPTGKAWLFLKIL